MADREGDIQASTRGAKEDSAGGVVQLTDAQGRLTMKRGIFRRGLLAVGSAALIVLAGSPSLGQAPKTGGVLSLRLREDLPQGFAINESPTISTIDRKSTRLNSSHSQISYAVFCLKKKNK